MLSLALSDKNVVTFAMGLQGQIEKKYLIHALGATIKRNARLAPSSIKELKIVKKFIRLNNICKQE